MFNFINTSKIFTDCVDVEYSLNQKLTKQYGKTEKCVKSLPKEVNFKQYL